MNSKEKAVILLSGGLDSLVSLDIASKTLDVKLALTFDYSQKAFNDECLAASEISKLYKIEHKVIKLPYLASITDNALTDDDNNDFNNLKSVWVPNRNGLFLNIAATYCDKFKYDYVIIGANLEEGQDFPDNTIEFINACDKYFEYSTLNKVKVSAPCINMKKIDIINYAIQNNLPLNLIKSCYRASEGSRDSIKKHCGKCMSCKLLYKALKELNRDDIIGEIF